MTILKNVGFIEVLKLISDYSEVAEKTFLINDEVEITGSLSDFEAMRKELKDESKVLRNLIYDCETEINQPISSIELYNYFKVITNGFSTEETRITLYDMYCFRDMILHEELGHLAKLEYIKNNWPIPTYTKTGKLGTHEFEDVKKMRDKVFPLHGLLFYEAISLLKTKLENRDEDKNDLQSGNYQTYSYQIKLSAKHYALAYIFECHALGKSLLSGKKTALERIGNERIGKGKGNRFYKAFNEITQIDLNMKFNLVEIGGEEWRKAIIELTKFPIEVEQFLESKGL